MFAYRLNQILALIVSLSAFLGLALTHGDPHLHLRLALLIYSSLLIAIVTTFALKNLVGQVRYQRFGGFLCLTSVGIYLLFASSNPLMLGLGWSISGAGAILLVNHANNRRSRLASLQIALWFLISDSTLWCALLLAHLNHINVFGEISGSGDHRRNLYNFIAILLVVSGLIRSGAFPAMRWLILTSEAPSPLSAFLHAGIVNGFGYLLIALPIIHRAWIGIVVIAALTITLSLSIMRHRHDEKGKLANGTSMQMAFMALEGVLGIPGIVLLHIVGHGSYKSWSFLRAGGAPLRKKNVMPLELNKVKNMRVNVLLSLIFLLAISTAMFLLGGEYLLNISVIAIAFASSLIYIQKLPPRLLVQSTVLNLSLFIFYIALIRFCSLLFPNVGKPSVFLAISLSIFIVLITGLLRATPRRWTLRLASRINRHGIAHKNLLSVKRKIREVSTSSLEEARVRQLVDVASAPFAEGMALSRIVAQDSMVGLHHLDYQSAADIAKEYGVSLYSSAAQYLFWLEQGAISLDILHQCIEESPLNTLNITSEEFINNTKRHLHQENQVAKEFYSRFPTRADELASDANWWCSQSWFDGDPIRRSGAYQIWRSTLPNVVQELFAAEPVDALSQILPLLISQFEGGTTVSDSEILRLLQRLISIDISWFLFAKNLGMEAQISILALRAGLLLLSDKVLEEGRLRALPHAEIWQLALERSYSRQLLKEILDNSSTEQVDSKNQVSIITCIDVRSDLLRAKAEEFSGVRTVGMAGFFGIDLCLVDLEQSGNVSEYFAPIILTPSLSVIDKRQARFLWALPSLWKHATSGSGALGVAEGFGLFNGLLSGLNTFAPSISKKMNRYIEPSRWLDSTGTDLSALSETQKLDYAKNIITMIAPLDTELSQEVLFVGHGADASNTPFRSMYECGACGGNNGGLNARFAANLMNDPLVQSMLESRFPGRKIHFYAAEHNTTAGTLAIDPLQENEFLVSASPTLRKLVRDLENLPRRKFPTSPELINLEQKKASAWWQVFPEWGLSGNAACVIGARDLTRNLNLNSRVFLHEYVWQTDLTGEVLESILSGPGTVMQMINSAYNITITSPQNFGSGDKTRHNVLGEAGVLLGAGGPLLRGMPWQAISSHEDRSTTQIQGHVPIRLQIFIAAPESILTSAINRSSLAPLVAGGWISIHPLPVERATGVKVDA